MQKLGIDARQTGRNDLTIDGLKFSGNAEHVNKNRVLHHGTILFSSVISDLSGALKSDPSKYSGKATQSVRSRVTNISDHLPKPMEITEFMEMIQDHVLNQNPDARIVELTEDMQREIQYLVDQKYNSWEWNFGYSPQYDFKKQYTTISGQNINIHLHVKGGVIMAARIDSESMPVQDTVKLELSLIGVQHSPERIRQLANGINIEVHFSFINREEFINLFF
jgi:lipoate-protein ligase A